jgi:hypothetical protein
VLSMWPCKKYFSHPSFSYLLFKTPTAKNSRETTTNSNPPGPIKLSSKWETERAVNKYDLIVFIRLFHWRPLESCSFLQSHSSLFFEWIDCIWLLHLIQHFWWKGHIFPVEML